MTILKAYATEQDYIIEDAIKKYESKKEKYGESWKEMTINELQRRLAEEIRQWKQTQDYKEDYNELLDIINVSTMLGVKYQEHMIDKFLAQKRGEKK